MALWENDTQFAYRHMGEPCMGEELAKLWPIGKFPVLVDEGHTVVETSVTIEHLDRHHRGKVRFLPDDPVAALEVRLLDRFFDQYVMNAATAVVAESLRRMPDRLSEAKEGAAEALEIAYAWLEKRLTGRAWAGATTSPLPIAPQHRLSVTATGCIRSATLALSFALIARG